MEHNNQDSTSHSMLLSILNAEAETAAVQEAGVAIEKVAAARLRAQALKELRARLGGPDTSSAVAPAPPAKARSYREMEEALRRLETGAPLPSEPNAKDLRQRDEED